MPVPKPNKGEDQKAFIGRCISFLKKEDPQKPDKQIQAICFDTFRKSRGENMIMNQKMQFLAPLNIITEAKNITEGKKNSVKIKGTMLPAATSRNGRTYTLPEIEKARVSNNIISVDHSESIKDNVGAFKYEFIPGKGLEFEAKINNTPYHPGIVDIINAGLVNSVSIEAIAQELEPDKEDSVIVRGIDITGLGLVKTPGMENATFSVAENCVNCIEEAFKILHDKHSEEVINMKKLNEETSEEETKEEETEKKEEPSGKPEEKPSETESLKTELKALKEEVSKLKEIKSKGKITETTPQHSYNFKLTKKVNEKDGSKIDFFAEDANELY